MELRRELTPPPISEAAYQTVRGMVEVIEAELDSGGNADAQIQEFNQFTGRHYDESMFRRYWRSMDLDEFVRQASRPKPKPVLDVTREELVEVARRAMPQSGDPDYQYYMEIFDANAPRPAASNLIFYPADYDAQTNTWGGGRSMGEYDSTPEEIVAQALSSSV